MGFTEKITFVKDLGEVVDDNKEFKKLIFAVLKQLGYQSKKILSEDAKSVLTDITRHGADGGFRGFIYIADTVEFYEKNKSDILKLAKNLAESLGSGGLLELIKSFRCFHNDYNIDEIGETIYGENDNKTIKNALAFFALEEVARMFTE